MKDKQRVYELCLPYLSLFTMNTTENQSLFRAHIYFGSEIFHSFTFFFTSQKYYEKKKSYFLHAILLYGFHDRHVQVCLVVVVIIKHNNILFLTQTRHNTCESLSCAHGQKHTELILKKKFEWK